MIKLIKNSKLKTILKLRRDAIVEIKNPNIAKKV